MEPTNPPRKPHPLREEVPTWTASVVFCSMHFSRLLLAHGVRTPGKSQRGKVLRRVRPKRASSGVNTIVIKPKAMVWDDDVVVVGYNCYGYPTLHIAPCPIRWQDNCWWEAGPHLFWAVPTWWRRFSSDRGGRDQAHCHTNACHSKDTSWQECLVCFRNRCTCLLFCLGVFCCVFCLFVVV